MITVKIPAAIRKHSPVLWTLGPASTVSGGVVHIHGDGSLSVASRQGGLLYEDDEVPCDAAALIISDPTGAAHLAWWLDSVPCPPGAHIQRLDAIRASVLTYQAAWSMARVGHGAAIGARGLEVLRDYAHRVAGVTNG